MSRAASSTLSSIATSARPERRGHHRFPCPETTCRISSTKEQTVWTARVVDLSAGGVGLLVDRSLQPGEQASIQIGSDRESLSVLMKVVHVAPVDDRCWLVGGVFVPSLAADDVQQLLQ